MARGPLYLVVCAPSPPTKEPLNPTHRRRAAGNLLTPTPGRYRRSVRPTPQPPPPCSPCASARSFSATTPLWSSPRAPAAAASRLKPSLRGLEAFAFVAPSQLTSTSLAFATPSRLSCQKLRFGVRSFSSES